MKIKFRKPNASELLIFSNRIFMAVLLLLFFHVVYVMNEIEGVFYWTPMLTNMILLARFTVPWRLIFEKVK